MSELVKGTRGSTELWVSELMDSQEAILRKIRQCNRQSPASELGYKVAATQYWPLILDSYKLLLPNLVRLFNEVDGALASPEIWVPTKRPCIRRMWLAWFAIAPVQQTVGRTSFDKEVKAQWIYQQEEPEKVRGGVGFTVPLGNDRKRSVGKFKEAKTKAWARRGVSNSRRVDEGEEDGEYGDLDQS
jgi:hypothetical protein